MRRCRFPVYRPRAAARAGDDGGAYRGRALGRAFVTTPVCADEIQRRSGPRRRRGRRDRRGKIERSSGCSPVLQRGLGAASVLFGEPDTPLKPALRRASAARHRASSTQSDARENLESTQHSWRRGTRKRSATDWLERVARGAPGGGPATLAWTGFRVGWTAACARALRCSAARRDVLDDTVAEIDAGGAAIATALVREAMGRGCAVLASAHSAGELEELGFANHDA